MEALGGASSVIAVIELSAKVAGLCLQYYKNVKKAKGDIEYLLEELNRLNTILKGAQQLLESPNSKKLETSQHLHSGLQSCYLQLEKLYAQLEETLNVGKRHQVMSRIGIRTLQWPFQRTDINTIIRNFKNYRDDLSAALTIDQTTQILDINQTLVFSNLPTAKNAAFESHANEHNAQCHPETRVDLRRDIMTWAEDSQSKCIFWLNGMAGTGKSTISRTVAQSFAGKGILGGSFFFKRGERDRGNAALLFTSIAVQLVNKMPVFAASIKDAIDVDHALSTKTLKEQFEQLILKPLACLNEHPRKFKKVVLVIDALDECEGDNDIKVIIHLLSQAKLLESVQLKTFVTSRPELPIRLGFNSIRGEYQDIVLHKIPAPIIEHDITAFLEYELSDIRKEYNIQMPDIQHLPSDWPGCEIIQKLVQMAVPLFIFAATTCRFIKDPAWSDPIGQLNKILGYRNQYTEVDKLDATYRPILDQLLIDKVEPARESIVQDFRLIVSSIVLLAEPLSIKFLARLLNLQESKIYGRLNSLHSVMDMPASTELPVRIFHLSFRDFLIDPIKCGTHPFWVDEKAAHETIATRCLEILSSKGCLKKNICNLHTPGITNANVDPAIIDSCLPADVRYACLYWAYHLERSSACITNSNQAYIFLKNHFLHWLEALSLLGKISESIAIIRGLQALTGLNDHTEVSSFLYDAKRFVLHNRTGIEQAPLQIYCSALFFAPEKSIIRKTFQEYIPSWIYKISRTRSNWSAALQTLEGHSNWVSSVAFSPDSKMIASGSGDNTIRLWDTTTGESLQTLEGHSGWISSIAFSPDSKMIASSSWDYTIRLWDTATGELLQTFEGYSKWVTSVAFSPDGKMIASGSWDYTIQLWDTATGELLQTLKGCSNLEASSVFDRYSISNNWIIEIADGEMRDTLWLPPDYRPRSIYFYKGIIVMVYESGGFFFSET